jgi:DNA-binding transcriptional MocR family regulator
MTSKVILSLVDDLSKKRGYCFAGNESLAEQCGISVSYVKKALKQLESEDYIRIIGKASKRKIYTDTRVSETVEEKDTRVSENVSKKDTPVSDTNLDIRACARKSAGLFEDYKPKAYKPSTPPDLPTESCAFSSALSCNDLSFEIFDEPNTNFTESSSVRMKESTWVHNST